MNISMWVNTVPPKEFARRRHRQISNVVDSAAPLRYPYWPQRHAWVVEAVRMNPLLLSVNQSALTRRIGRRGAGHRMAAQPATPTSSLARSDKLSAEYGSVLEYQVTSDYDYQQSP